MASNPQRAVIVTDTHLVLSRRAVTIALFATAGVVVWLGTYAVVVSLQRLPAWFPYLAAAMLALTLTVITWGYLRMVRTQRRPVRIELRNALGMTTTTVTLEPGQSARCEALTEQDVCDRGLESKDGKHRLVTRTTTIPFDLHRPHHDA